MKITGIDHAIHVPQGSTIGQVYWSAPAHGTIGPEFPTQADALARAILDKTTAIDRHAEAYPDAETRVPLPETMTIDLRWSMVGPGGAHDLSVARYVYESVTEARAALTRLNPATVDLLDGGESTLTYGPSGNLVAAIIAQAAAATDEDLDRLQALFAPQASCPTAAVGHLSDAIRASGRGRVAHLAQVAAHRSTFAPRDPMRYAAEHALNRAVTAVLVSDLVGQHGLTQVDIDEAVAPWAEVMGPLPFATHA